eukprot:3279237-Rhodomonas_salina.1
MLVTVVVSGPPNRSGPPCRTVPVQRLGEEEEEEEEEEDWGNGQVGGWPRGRYDESNGLVLW